MSLATAPAPAPAPVALLTTAEAAAESRRHPTTIRKALEAGELHGVQRVAGGRWFIERECLHAHMTGKPCPHAAVRPPIQLRRK